VDAVLGLDGRVWAQSYAEQSIPRALFARNDIDSLRRFAELTETALPPQATVRILASGLLALADGLNADAVRLLGEAVEGEKALEAVYAAACLELELAGALAASGDAAGAEHARRQADAVLQPLGVVNPI